MSLIERYVFEVGRNLPRNKREDILDELRSLIIDTLEDRAGSDPTENDVAEVLKEFGPPKKVAASYFPEGQYLIGPTLFPTFKMVTIIAISASIGAQLLAVGIQLVFGSEIGFLPDVLWGMLNSIPITLGVVVLVFFFLQRLDLRPEMDLVEFDPTHLPYLEDTEPVSRFEHLFGIVFGVIFLALFPALFTAGIEISDRIPIAFFDNPVIVQYMTWIMLSILFGIIMDVLLLWRGRWSATTRVLKLGTNLFSAFVLFLLIQGHNAWLAARDVGGFFEALSQFANDLETNWQIFGMAALRLGMMIALIVVLIDTGIQLFKFARNHFIGNSNDLRLKKA